MVKAVEDSNGFDAWRSLNTALKPTWPACSMNSALQPQLLKLEEVFDETVRAGATIQEELKSAILLRTAQIVLDFAWRQCSILNFEGTSVAMGSFSTEEATLMVASSSTDYQGPMPMDIDRAQNAKGKGKKGKNDHQKGKGKDAKSKGKKGKGDQKGKGKGKDQTRQRHLWETRTSCSETVGGTIFDRLQVIQPIHLQRSVSDYSYSWSTTSHCLPAE